MYRITIGNTTLSEHPTVEALEKALTELPDGVLESVTVYDGLEGPYLPPPKSYLARTR